MKIIFAYIPVLHQGYKELFDKNKDVDELWLVGESFATEFKEIRKDIRRIEPKLVKQAIESWGLFRKVKILEVKDFEELKSDPKSGLQLNQQLVQLEVIAPNDEMLKQIIDQHLNDVSGVSVKYEPIFLRWDKHNSVTEKQISNNNRAGGDNDANQPLNWADFNQKIMMEAFAAAEHSTDWWRHIGAVIVRDGQVQQIGYNKHLPTENAPYLYNDVRSLFSQGKYFELVSSIHAEAMTIAEAARKGIPTEGADIYVTTFPCPICAKQIAQAGIKRLFYSGNYSMLDGEDILAAAGVELIKVDLPESAQPEITKLEAAKSMVKQYE